MKIGKITADKLEQLILNQINYHHKDVLVHAGIGEDSAVVDFGDQVLVVSTDPITGAVENAGFLAVHITCNDLAATGANPVGLQVALLLPESISDKEISELMEEIHKTAASLEVEILGGHTEIVSSVKQPQIVMTGIGKAPRDNYIPTGGAKPGDKLIVTKGVGIEGVYILAVDFEKKLIDRGVKTKTISRAKKYRQRISVLAEGLIAARNGASALHDITEGGLYGSLMELSRAADTGFKLDLSRVPVDEVTSEICGILGIDPLGLISSGSMLIAAKKGEEMVERLKEDNIKACVIGSVEKKAKKIIMENGIIKDFTWSGEDELWKWMEKVQA